VLKNIVFLICSERSGSNLIRALLNNHPGINSPAPFHIGRDFGRNLYAFGEDLYDDDNWQRLAKSIRSRLNSSLTKSETEKIYRHLLAQQERNYASIIESIYASTPGLNTDDGETILFLKENHIQKQAFFLLHHFPDAKFVFQVRDPRDYLASLRSLRPGLFGNKYGSTRHALEVWREDQLGGLNLKSHLGPKRVFLQRYEDLIENPELVLTELCHFLNIDYDPIMLRYHEKDDIKKLAVRGGPRENLAKPIMSSNTGQYRHKLKKRHIRIVEHYIGHLMEVFGYEMEFKPAGRAKLFWTLWSQFTEPFERIANWDFSPLYPEANGKMFERLERQAMPLSFSYKLAPNEQSSKTSIRPARSNKWRMTDGFIKASSETPDSPALSVAGVTYSYRKLYILAKQIAFLLSKHEHLVESPKTAILTDRSWVTYAAILAALMRGHTYVPLNIKFPAMRNRDILIRSGASSLIVDKNCSELLAEILETGDEFLKAIISPDTLTKEDFPFANENLITKTEIDGIDTNSLPARVHDNDHAYILFTSGSTGRAKGVPVKHANVEPFIKHAINYLELNMSDRVSQTFDITFDPSIFDLFTAWTSGAHLIVPSRLDLMTVDKFLVKEKITIFCAVPSLAQQVNRQASLIENSFPLLRISLFCGEALPVDLARLWDKAAPNSILENWYGPTEATIVCMHYRWSENCDQNGDFNRDFVPIGVAFPGLEAGVFNIDQKPVRNGEQGELLLSGQQVTDGYLDDDEQTSSNFCTPPGQTKKFYRTGDLVLIDSNGQFQFLGRLDNQIKLQGYRIELGEVETALRKMAPTQYAQAIPWPAEPANSEYLVGVIEKDDIDKDVLLEKLRHSLPTYMVPRQIFCVESLPLNSSGKTDRKQVADLIPELLNNSPVTGDEDNNIIPDDLKSLLIKSIQEIHPDIQREKIYKAENLFMLGMDSFEFISLTEKIETLFSKKFTQFDIANLASLSLSDMVNVIITSGNTDKTKTKGKHPFRERTKDFITNFPKLINQNKSPLAFFFGSSLLFRGFSCKAFEQNINSATSQLRAVNIGLPGLDVSGLNEISQYVTECCNTANQQPHLLVLELDPMMVSTLPPFGEHEFVSDILSNNISIENKPASSLPIEFEWNLGRSGDISIARIDKSFENEPDWRKKRNKEIIKTYIGEVEFNPVLLDVWLETARLLIKLADHSVILITPLNLDYIDSDNRKQDTPNLYHEMLEKLRKNLDIKIINYTDLKLEPKDFIDINHINTTNGATSFSIQLAQLANEILQK
jgi:amino acid adenylation domain-containing protein